MPTLRVRFTIQAHEYSEPSESGYGPLFHRWRPSSDADAISLPTLEPNTSLRVWFERRGYTKSVGLELQDRQVLESGDVIEPAFLEGGPLWGELTLLDLDEFEVEEG